MTDEFVSEWARGRLATYDGATIGVLVVDGDGADAAVDTMAFVSEVTISELARGTTLATVDQVGSVGVLNVETVLLDTSSGYAGGVWYFDNSTGSDSTRRLLAFLPTVTAPGFVDWPASAPNGIGTWRRGAASTTTAAASVSYDNASSGLTATDAQAAIDELAAAGGSGGGTALTAHAMLATDTDVTGGTFTTVDVVDFDGTVLSAGIPRAAVVGKRALIVSGANTGLWTITASGACTQTATPGGTLVSVVQLGVGTVQVVVGTQGTDPIDTGAAASEFVAIDSSNPDFMARLLEFHPVLPIKPELHVSKYVTFDPAFPLDGTATHVGGQPVADGQNITIATATPGLSQADPDQKGGIWTLHLGSPATRATGLGSVPGSEVANYDHVSYTGTRWAAYSLWRLFGNPLRRGMVPDLEADPPHSGITFAVGVGRHYRADVIARTRTGTTLTVLEADGSTTSVDASAWTGEQCVLVMDSLELLSIDDGVVEGVEDFTYAEGQFVGQGVGGAGIGAVAEIVNGTAVILTPGSSGGTGDVAGPASATDGHVALFDGTTGKLIKDGGPVTAAGLALLDDADATAQRATLGTGGILAGQDEKTGPANTTTETSLLTSTLTATGTAGDVLTFTAAGTYTQNSGGSTTPTIRLKLGGTTVLTWSQSFTNSATVRKWEITATLRVNASSDVNASGTMLALNAPLPCDVGTSTGAIQSGIALDLTWQHGSATSTQTADLAYCFLKRDRPI